MKVFRIIILFALLVVSCDSQKGKIETEQQNIQVRNDSTPRVTGIGGIFFYSNNPKELRNWYGENLGIIMDDYGAVFEFRNSERADELNYLRWSAFMYESEHFKPSEKDFMVNYRVQNITAMVEQLRKNGAIILDTITEYPYGKFVHILDPEGNKLELWEPIDSVLTQMGGKTNK